MDKRKSEIIAALKEGADQTLAFYHSLTPEQFGIRVYQDGARWTAAQVLAHLITIEKSMHHLFRDILAGGPGSPPDFDIERFNRSQPAKLADLTLAQLEERYRSTRNETIKIVADMHETDLDRRGRHAFHGPGTLERFVRWAYEHEASHIRDTHRALGI